ncbi:Predicted membrane protein (DUF2207) [Actinobaculum suis]|uniref:Predicted membrane protein (DUF2207) n=1 Tax=Actinobaculum suis TaxID=1657 RepID=A0A7Z9C7R5_9ACTO|nr:DUF2207 domain-containing protein [Actinobaculum suis]VDG75654.1 Predicted membrane protein (DUF2207) [Actinobaculum suis]
MRALWAALVAAFLIITTAPVAGASEIYTIDIDAEIQADGSAIITDTRTFEATEGTEHYISFGNLRDSDVHSFSVVLDGQPLTDIGDWDVNASRREKAGKSGVVDTGDGYELSFGFGEYGRHTAVMTYTVTNFVYTLSDGAQTVFWQFLPRNMTDTKFVSISLRNTVGVTHTHENTRIWGFGYEGESVITTNSLRLATSKPITSNNHMTMLAIFPEPLFTSNVNRPEDTESLIKRAKEGSDWEDSNPLNGDTNDLFSKAITVIGAVAIFGILGYVGRAFLVAFLRAIRPKRSKSAEYVHSGPRTPRAESEYWREVPYNGPITDIYTLRGYALPDLATALLLKWIHEGALREVQHEAGWVFKREEAAFAIVHMPQLHSDVEATYWDFIVRAARDDGILQRKEIEKFTRKNTSEVSKWQTAAFNYSRQRQIELGLRTVVEKKERVFFINYTKRNSRSHKLEKTCATKSTASKTICATSRSSTSVQPQTCSYGTHT